MTKNPFGSFLVRNYRWFLTLFIVSGLISGVFLYFLAGDRAEKTMVERIQSQELTLARAGALSIENFFKESKSHLLVLSQTESIRRMDVKTATRIMEVLVSEAGEIMPIEVILVDKDGNALWAASPYDSRFPEAESLADRDYFLWAKQQTGEKKVFISDPLSARGGTWKGEPAVVMATPVFYQNNFNGVILIGFPLKYLIKRYVEPLAFSPQSDSVVISEDGTVIISANEEIVGQKLINYLEEKNLFQEASALKGLMENMSRGQEWSGLHPCFRYDWQQAISVATPIEINGKRWFLLISTDYNEVLEITQPLKVMQAIGFILGLSLFVVLFLFFIFGLRMAQRDAFLNGFKKARDGKKV